MSHHHKTIQQLITLQVLQADRLVKTTKEVESSRFDFSDVTRLATQLTHLLRSTARLVAASATTFYDRPLRSVLSDVSSNLERAQTLVRKCKNRSSILRQVFAITTSADVRKVSSLLETSIADMKWLVSIFANDDSGGASLTLPPIASNDPVLAWVWSNVAMVQHSSRVKDRVDAANSLASLASDNDRNKNKIIEEDGVTPLLRLLKEGASPEAQTAAAKALYNLGADREKVSGLVRALAVPVIVQVLNDSTNVAVRTNVVNLVSKMAETGLWVQEEFGRENVIRPIVTFLANDVVFEDFGTRMNPLARVGSEIGRSSFRYNGFCSKKETELCSPEEKIKLKISCAKALWILAKGSLLNSTKITETKALICLAKLVEHETEELQVNCLMAVTELAKVAESNSELRRQAFKPSSPAARTVLDQVLRVLNHETNPNLVALAIASLGFLARTFPAKETRIIGPLVSKLDHQVPDIATEAVIALTKFVNPENFNHLEHSRAILELNGVPQIMSFLKRNDSIKIQVHGLRLLCYLAIHAGNSKALEQARALSVIEGAARSMVTQYSDMKELFAKAIHHLNLYQGGNCAHKQPFVSNGFLK